MTAVDQNLEKREKLGALRRNKDQLQALSLRQNQVEASKKCPVGRLQQVTQGRNLKDSLEIKHR